MNDLVLTKEMLLMVLPLILIHLGLATYCIVDILKKGTQYLNATAWIFIVLIINLFGPIAYLLVGRRKDDLYD